MTCMCARGSKFLGLQPTVIASRAPHLLLELRFKESWTCVARQLEIRTIRLARSRTSQCFLGCARLFRDRFTFLAPGETRQAQCERNAVLQHCQTLLGLPCAARPSRRFVQGCWAPRASLVASRARRNQASPRR